MSLIFIALSLASQSTESVAIPINTRDMSGLNNRQDIIRGTCDGRPASATITKAYRGAAGRLVLRGGRWTRDVPPTFLGGSLFTNHLQSVGLACDGRRLQLHAVAVRADRGGELVMDVQNAILDMRTGIVTLTELHTYSPAETRAELGLGTEAQH